ncbi:MAG: GNAT family protein [Chloroflexota bacterium]
MITIKGIQIRLRDMQLSDLVLYQRWQQPGHLWQALDGPYYPKATPKEVDSLIEKIRGRIKANSWPSPRSRMVIASQESDELIGMVTRYWISQETKWSAVGIVIFNPDDWGKGIGYEALSLWCRYLFEQYPDWVRIDLRTWSGNIGMCKLALKLGFKEEARFRNARIVNGEYYDGMGYGILRKEFENRYNNRLSG